MCNKNSSYCAFPFSYITQLVYYRLRSCFIILILRGAWMCEYYYKCVLFVYDWDTGCMPGWCKGIFKVKFVFFLMSFRRLYNMSVWINLFFLFRITTWRWIVFEVIIFFQQTWITIRYEIEKKLKRKLGSIIKRRS